EAGAPCVLGGGGRPPDGGGTARVTESCRLSAGRNPAMSRQEIEAELCQRLGVEKVLWLPRGIYNDETNEHVDNVCAFVGPAQVVLAWTTSRSEEHTSELQSRFDLVCRLLLEKKKRQ